MRIARYNAFRNGACVISLAIAAATATSPTEVPARAVASSEEPGRIACDIGHCDTPLANRLVHFLQPVKNDTAMPERAYAGIESCSRCHTSEAAGFIVIDGVKITLQQEQWVLYNELKIWDKKDKHKQSYSVLLKKRSQQMGELLGVKEVHRDRRCLACHTGFSLSQMPEKDGLVDTAHGMNVDVIAGVSCEGCHAPANDSKAVNGLFLSGWLAPHQVAPKQSYDKTVWRFQSPQHKFEQTGFIDVRTPTSKTKLCVSCHIGDVAQGRVVTHEMYAAGHPPLPGFEIETFVAQMPKHWKEFSAKSEQVQEMFLKHTNDPLFKGTYKVNSLHRTRSLLAGALVVSSEYLRLMGQLADENVRTPVKKTEWPELSAFDCYACHHDLKQPSWRQNRKASVGTPGRPPLQDWPFALTKIALKSLGTSRADTDEKLAAVHKTLSAQPFGNAKDLAKPAQDASVWFFEKGRELERKPVSREDAVGFLKEISHAAVTEIHDYDSARQLVWAFQVIQGDLKGDLANSEKIEALFNSLGKEMFYLDLRAEQPLKKESPDDPMGRLTVEIDLEKVLPFAARYDPAQFQARFKEVENFLK